MRVAFTPFVDPSWTGGIQYLRNLFAALADIPARPIEPVLFVPPGARSDAVRALRPLLSQDPVVVPSWSESRSSRLLSTMLTGRDRRSEAIFRESGVDLVFENDVWFGTRFGLPTLAWIADFQHCHLPHMFTPWQRYKRSAKYRAYCSNASAVMVSSNDGKADCEHFFPDAVSRIHAVPFAVAMGSGWMHVNPRDVAAAHDLPEKYFYFPGQMWRHKNHAKLIEALCLLKTRGAEVVIVASGNAADVFRPDYPRQVLQSVEQEGLQSSFRFLGHIPYDQIMPLMRGAAAVVNPSLFEGWSTVVEEAKAVGVPLLLSGLRVHREQAPPGTHFFDPHSADDMATVLQQAWDALPAGPRPNMEKSSAAAYELKRLAFGRRFIEVAELATQTRV